MASRGAPLTDENAEAILRAISQLSARLDQAAPVPVPSVRLVSKTQAAKILGVSRGRTLDRLIKEGTIRTVLIGSRLKISMAEVERLAREGEPRTETSQPIPVRPGRPVRSVKNRKEEPDWDQELARAKALRI